MNGWLTACELGAGSHVGNLLGAGDFKTARIAARVDIALVLAISGIAALALLLARNYWGSFFSSNKDVQDMVADLLFHVASYIVLDGGEFDLVCDFIF